jgi:hypothetical protein
MTAVVKAAKRAKVVSFIVGVFVVGDGGVMEHKE